jgi:serine/threonine protein kinase/formylglycine-generating enzyme required for sulfatase activity
MIDLDVGDVIAGKYEIKKVLGAGGMGKVYRARQVDLGRDVALKVPSEAVLQSPDIMARFSREAKTVAKLMHDNIVQVYEYYQDPEMAFIAMEFVEGDDLKNTVTASPRDMTVGDMATILERSCEGLAHAHEFGIVHRDIKPHNIMVARLPRGKWRVKVMDFGIAHVASNAQFTEMDGGQLTQTGQALGTPSYMAPEQIRGSGVSHLSDIYSFGCVIYFCFTQQTVFTGSGLTVAVAHLNEQPPSIRSLIPTISPEFDHLILRCLEKDPAKRPQDASELGQAIRRALEPIRDMPMEQIWRETRQASNATIPIIVSPTTPSAAGGPSHRFEEVKTQGTMGRTGLTDSERQGAGEAATMAGGPMAEAPKAGAPQAGATLAGAPLVEAPPSSASVASAIPTKKNMGLVIGGVAAACLVVGVGAVVALKGLGGSGQTNGNNGAQPTVQPTMSVATATAPPTSTENGGASTPSPDPTQVAIARTPTPTPEARVTPPPTPTATPTPDEPVYERQLNDLQFRLRDARSFTDRLGHLRDIANLWTGIDQAFDRRVIEAHDAAAVQTARTPDLVAAPSGAFTMGNDEGEADERPSRNVLVSPFQIGRYEVTALEFSAFLNQNLARAKDLYEVTDATNIEFHEGMQRYMPRERRHFHPANNVTWNAANEYAKWLSEQTGKPFRLPTEAEWESAARGGFTALPFPWGRDTPSAQHAHYQQTRGTIEINLMPQGRSSTGSFHMAGNVAEWCSDWYAEDYYATGERRDPKGPAAGDRKVLRGGSYLSYTPREISTTRREALEPDRSRRDVGFRLVLAE